MSEQSQKDPNIEPEQSPNYRNLWGEENRDRPPQPKEPHKLAPIRHDRAEVMRYALGQKTRDCQKLAEDLMKKFSLHLTTAKRLAGAALAEMARPKPSPPATDSQIITAAVKLLDEGLLPSALSARLMSDCGITHGRAQKLADEAVRRWKCGQGSE